MTRLRKTVQREILDTLDSSIYTSDDFNVLFGDTGEGQNLIDISFKYEIKYTYTVEKIADDDYYMTITPGDVEENETYRYGSLAEATKRIQRWCEEVRNELKANEPLYKEVDKLREIIEERIGATCDDSDEFSVKEIDDLKAKFNALQARVETLENDKIITKHQLSEFTLGLKQVSEDLEYYPKQTWLKTATNKLVKIVLSIGKSKEGRKLLADGAQKLIGLD